MRKLIIRQACINDFHDIYYLGSKCLPIYYNTIDLVTMAITGHTILAAIICHKKRKHLVGFIIGTHTYKNNNVDKYFHILSFAVDVKHRRQKIGSKLMNTIKNHTKNPLSLNVHVENKNAIKFYKKNGFFIKYTIKNYYKTLNQNIKSKDAYYMTTE